MDKDCLEGGVEGVAEPSGRKGKEMEGGTWQVRRGQGTHWGKAISEEEGMGNWECFSAGPVSPYSQPFLAGTCSFPHSLVAEGSDKTLSFSWGVFWFCRDKFIL